ncbi:MAG TPA: nuclear transport factor 2 family protein [Acidimicrobiales bacterium]|nr:nuclear transport factor 2 family protein [Acidimicrobiales bacterium]
MEPSEPLAREMKDRDDIARLARLYARGIDRRDWDLVRSCFSDDAKVHGSRKVADLDEYLPDLRSGVEYFPATMHFMGNQLVDVDGDTGTVETYAIAYHWKAEPAGSDGDGNLVMGVRYHDTVQRIDGTWKITARSVDADWRQGSFPPPA